MRTIFFFLTIFSISIAGCNSNVNNDSSSEVQSQQNEAFGSRVIDESTPISIDEAVKNVILGLKNQDTSAINRHIHTDKGMYFIQSGQGVYSQYFHYFDLGKLLSDSEASSEFEINPLKYLLDYLNNVNAEEVEIMTEDLFGIDACEFENEGFFVDSNEADIKLLTDIYSMNVTAEGSEINPDELVKLGEVQNEVSKTIIISDGQESYTLYFTFENEKWWLSIMDLRDCVM